MQIRGTFKLIGYLPYLITKNNKKYLIMSEAIKNKQLIEGNKYIGELNTTVNRIVEIIS